ncbi:MAG: alpha/beta hydrolase [Paracoccaceae bacterium]
MSALKTLIAAIALLYLAVLAAMFLFQRNLQYFPTNRAPAPATLGLTGVTVETLTTPDGETLRLWYAPAPANNPTILFFHGNAGEVADRADRFAFWQVQGYGVAFLSPRGYGGSTGRITEDGLITDATTAYDWLIARSVPAEKIILIGESLGTGLAVQLAAKRPVAAVVLEAPYTSAADVAARAYPWLPVRLLMKDQLRSIDHIAAVTAPILILHGTDDRVIPYDLGRALYDATTAPTMFTTLEGQGHEALYDPATWSQEAAFLKSTLVP